MPNHNRLFLFCLCVYFLLHLPFFASGQQLGKRLFYEFQHQNGQRYAMPTAGGLGNPQFSEADLNGDGRLDLFVFDRVGDVALAFRNNGTPNKIDYTYAPEWLVNFPKNLYGWVLLRDFNADGAPDIFCFSEQSGAGIEAYKGRFNAQNVLEFTKYLNSKHPNNALTYTMGNNTNNHAELYVPKSDVPAVDDIDGDGDLDILSFSSGGGAVELFKNISVESGWQRDSLRFTLADVCWGRFFESVFTNDVELSNHPDTCANSGIFAGRGTLHAGSTTLTIDIDGDGDKDILLGDVAYPNLTLLVNAGNKNKAFMTSQDATFPTYNLPAQLPVFPAPFSLDVDNDGKKDLIASYNATSGEDIEVAWLYKNISNTNVVTLRREGINFLGDAMLDQGSMSAPALVDYNADGLMDVVVGAVHFTTLTTHSALVLYQNIGTTSNPMFKIVNSDYLSFSQFNQTTLLSPTFGDLDGDGDDDLLVGEVGGQLFFVENMAGMGNPLNFGEIQTNYKKIDVGGASAPMIFDADKDGLADIVVGEQNGNLNFIKNIGQTNQPDFDKNHETAPNNGFWGGVDVRQQGRATGFSRPYLLKTREEKTFLVVGSEQGKIFLYDDFSQSTFPKKSTDYGSLNEGRKITPVLYDFDNNGYYDMLVGNSRGGLAFYETDIRSRPVPAIEVENIDNQIVISPNPTSHSVEIRLKNPTKPTVIYCKIVDVLGREIAYQAGDAPLRFDVSTLPNGIYYCNIRIHNNHYISKKIIKY